jgi:Docking domain of Afi1 for Arf3 in vesicle trafficking
MSAHDESEEHMSINDSEQAHVDYILTAEFDVDAGPVISHQYPEPLGGDVRYPPISPSHLDPDVQSNAGRVDVTRSGPQ